MRAIVRSGHRTPLRHLSRRRPVRHRHSSDPHVQRCGLAHIAHVGHVGGYGIIPSGIGHNDSVTSLVVLLQDIIIQTVPNRRNYGFYASHVNRT
jgi:hypothetical protein